MALDPRRGGAEAVAQAVLNVACSGAEPAAVTNCLNFGNPERPGSAYALREVITGMAEACEVLGTPVVSGNVSLYNESGGRPIHPTPVVGCVGVLEHADAAVPTAPAKRRGYLFALGSPRPPRTTAGVAGVVDAALWPSPEVIIPAAALALRPPRRAALDVCCPPAHDVSDGGLAVALSESLHWRRARGGGRDRGRD